MDPKKLTESTQPEPVKVNPDEFKGMTTREALAYWLALPTKVRNPASQKELAAILDVSEERLCQIKRDPKFKDDVMEYRKTFFKQFTSDVIDSLVKVAKTGNERAAKLFLQYVEDFQETSMQKIEKTERREFVFHLPEKKLDELRQEIRRLKANPEGIYVEEGDTSEKIPNKTES
jgi:hypothetical protein